MENGLRFFSGFGRLAVAAALVAFSASSLAQQRTPTSSADLLLKKALERARQDEKKQLAASYGYTQRNITDVLDSKGNVKRHEEREYQILPIEGVPYPRLIEINGRPLSPKREKEERERENKFRAQIQGRKKDPGAINFNEELVNKYQWSLAGRRS